MKLSESLGALTERNFRLFWVGRVTSAFGDQIAPIALAFAVLDLTGSAADLGYVLGAQTVPLAVFVLLGGIWADRVPRQLVMLASDLIRAGTQSVTAVLLLTGSAHIWELAVLAAVFGTGDAFFAPASVGLVPSTVSPMRLQQANALHGMGLSFASIIGPACGGAIVALISPGWALVIDAGTFVVSGVCLALVRLSSAHAARATSALAELREGFRLVRSLQWVWATIVFWGFLDVTAFAAFRVLGPSIAKHSLGGASAWGTILAVGGVGSLLGGFAALRVRSRRPMFTAIAVLLLWWPMTTLLAVRAPVWLIAASAIPAFAGTTWCVALWFTALQENIPASAISRVSSIDYLGTYVPLSLGYALVGVVAAHIGATETMLGATVIGLTATLVALSVTSIRNLERRPEPAEAALEMP